MLEKLARNQWILRQRRRSTSALSVTHFFRRRWTGSAARVRRDPRTGSPVADFARCSPIGCWCLCSWPADRIPQLFLFKRCESVQTTTEAENRESQEKRRGRVGGGGGVLILIKVQCFIKSTRSAQITQINHFNCPAATSQQHIQQKNPHISIMYIVHIQQKTQQGCWQPHE